MVCFPTALGGQQRKKVVTTELDWTCLSQPLGPHLRVGDLLQFDTRKALSASEVEDELLGLAKEFNAIRRAWDGPIRITAGYCPEPFNRQICGAADRYHVFGMALDLVPLDGSVAHFHRWLKRRWSGGLGYGRSKGSVHIDTRNRGRFSARANLRPSVSWTY